MPAPLPKFPQCLFQLLPQHSKQYFSKEAFFFFFWFTAPSLVLRMVTNKEQELNRDGWNEGIKPGPEK